MNDPLPFRFVLIRAPADGRPGAPVGLAYRARAHGELVWVMTLSAKAATHQRIARLLALLLVDQTHQVLPPTLKPPGPGTGLLMEDGSLRDGQRVRLSGQVHEEVGRLALHLLEKELYFLERVRRYFREDGLPPGFEPVPESHPSYDPALEQVFAPHPPLVLARELEASGP